MDATVAAGWIGAGAAFIGTVVGAGVSVWATVLTQRHEVSTAQRNQIEERGQAAGNNALSELYALRRHVLLWGSDLDDAARRTWTATGQEMADQVEMAAGLIPKADALRRDLEDALLVVVGCMHEDRHRPTTDAFYTKLAVNDAIGILLAFLRGDPLPEPTNRMEVLRFARAEHELENPPDVE